MNNFIKIYHRIHPAYRVLLYANFFLLFAFALDINFDSIKFVILKLLLVHFLMLIGGYFIHDLHDQKTDRIAQKFNISEHINKYALILIVIITWAFGLYLLYPVSKAAFILLIVEYLAIFLYSSHVPRLKEKGMLGLITDAVFEHLIMEIILIIIIGQYVKIPFLLWGPFLLFSFAYGMRGILSHQLEDLKNDIKSNTVTYATSHQVQAEKYVQYFENITSISLLSFFSFLLFINFTFVFLFLFLVLILCSIYVSYKKIELSYNPLIRNYIIISSFFFTYLLITKGNYFGLLLLIHPYYILFIRRIVSYRISFDFVIFGFITFIRFIVNYSLFCVFFLFGRNLKKRPLYKKSFLDFLFKK